MRQFSYLAWDAYEQVYSLAFKHSGVIERAGGHFVRQTVRSAPGMTVGTTTQRGRKSLTG